MLGIIKMSTGKYILMSSNTFETEFYATKSVCFHITAADQSCLFSDIIF